MKKAVLFIGLLMPVAQTFAVYNGDTTAPFNVQAPLDFRLDVEKFVFLQVGSTGTTVDVVRFDLNAGLPTPGATTALPTFGLGSGTPLAAASSGTLSVVVRGNAGTITLSATNNGSGLGLSNGSGGYLNYNQISTLSNNSGLPAPVLNNTGSTTVNVTANMYAGWVTDQSANWTYQLSNTAVPSAGTYTGQVTYTAAVP